jgi:hypothetical protein
LPTSLILKTLLAILFLAGSFYLGRISTSNTEIASTAAAALRSECSAQLAASIRMNTHTQSIISATSPSVDSEWQKSVPSACKDWVAKTPYNVFRQIVDDKETAHNEKNIRSVIVNPTRFDDPNADAGLNGAWPEIQSIYGWTAVVNVTSSEGQQTFYLSSRLDDRPPVGPQTPLIKRHIWFDATPPKSDNGCRIGLLAQSLATHDGNYIMDCHFYSGKLPGRISDIAATLPWTKGPTYFLAFDMSSQKWLEPISFSWTPVYSEAEWKEFQKATEVAP